MAKAQQQQQLSYISVPAPFMGTISLVSPKKHSNSSCSHSSAAQRSRTARFFFLFSFFSFLAMLKLGLELGPLLPGRITSPITIEGHERPCLRSAVLQPGAGFDPQQLNPAHNLAAGREITAEEEFWKQPDGKGYWPCLNFSEEYRKETMVAASSTMSIRRRYLMVVVSGGLNQQRNQIVDAVVIARILGAALVLPILQVNVVWADESEFSDIFDVEHFKRALRDDIHIVSSLPSTHLMSRPVEEKRTPIHVSPEWIRRRYQRRLNREGVLLLRGLDSRLSKDLPSDLQKLRCKVAFHALRFSAPIRELGNKLAERMWRQGPYLALHLRMEKDVWVRTGCLPGLTQEQDEIVSQERKSRPELLTARSNMTYHDRKLAGLCPLSALEVARLLKALGAPRSARIYWAGGVPLGGMEALDPLTREFPHFYNKYNLSLPGELEPFADKASFLAALDYMVSVNSDVFMPSHGGNMGHAIQGHRAYAGHRKYILPNKRVMLPYFLNTSIQEVEFNRIVKELHKDSLGQPEFRTEKINRDIIAYPVPECMCQPPSSSSI